MISKIEELDKRVKELEKKIDAKTTSEDKKIPVKILIDGVELK